MEERYFTFKHEGYHVSVTIWNECKDSPHVLYDWHNVLDVYPLAELAQAAGTEGQSYAVVSLLATKGDNFENLRQWAVQTGQCVVAVTAKFHGKRTQCETHLKYKVMKLLRWKQVLCAVDDKPHEWLSNDGVVSQQERLKLKAGKKTVFVVHFTR